MSAQSATRPISGCSRPVATSRTRTARSRPYGTGRVPVVEVADRHRSAGRRRSRRSRAWPGSRLAWPNQISVPARARAGPRASGRLWPAGRLQDESNGPAGVGDVVDDRRGAEFGQPLAAFGGRGHGGDAGAGGGREFGDVVADPAGGAGQQDAPPGDAARARSKPQRGQPGQRQRGGLDGRHAVAAARPARGRHRGVLGPAAGLGMPDHPLPRGRAGSVGGRLHHQPGDVLAGPPPGAGCLQLEVSPRLTENASTFTSASSGPGLGLGDLGEARPARAGSAGRDRGLSCPAASAMATGLGLHRLPAIGPTTLGPGLTTSGCRRR